MYRIVGVGAVCLGISLIIALSAKSEPGRIGVAEKAFNYVIPHEKDELRRLLHAELGSLENDSDLGKVKKILAHLASFGKIEFNAFDATKERYRALNIYKSMRFGNVGYLCNGHADMFLGALEIYGLTGRRILGESITPSHPLYQKYRTNEVYGSHSTVEVKIEGHWIIADPTFYVLPMYCGKNVSLRESLGILCRNPMAQFEYDAVADGSAFEKGFRDRPNDYFRDMMFARVIVYKPFHKYPYDDVCKCEIQTAQGKVTHAFSIGNGRALENLTPTNVPWGALHRDTLVLATHSTSP